MKDKAGHPCIGPPPGWEFRMPTEAQRELAAGRNTDQLAWHGPIVRP
jgi:hypothetical protein